MHIKALTVNRWNYQVVSNNKIKEILIKYLDFWIKNSKEFLKTP